MSRFSQLKQNLNQQPHESVLENSYECALIAYKRLDSMIKITREFGEVLSDFKELNRALGLLDRIECEIHDFQKAKREPLRGASIATVAGYNLTYKFAEENGLLMSGPSIGCESQKSDRGA